jgi:hypothetical protein
MFTPRQRPQMGIVDSGLFRPAWQYLGGALGHYLGRNARVRDWCGRLIPRFGCYPSFSSFMSPRTLQNEGQVGLMDKDAAFVGTG